MDNKKIVIGVIGTQNTGKTTFIKDVIEAFKGSHNEVKTVGCDYRRKIEEAGLKINREGNIEAQRIILNTLIEQLDIIESMPSGIYVTDRSPIDAFVYTLYLFRHKPELGITQKDMDEMLTAVKSSVARYDAIIYFPLDDCNDIEVVDDKFRDTNLAYRKQIDELFKETLRIIGHESLYGRLVTFIKGNRQERVQGMKSLLEAI